MQYSFDPQVVLDLSQQVMRDSQTFKDLAQSMPDKISQIEEGARNFVHSRTAADHFQQAMQALHQLAENMDAEQQFLKQLAQKMEELIAAG